MTDRPAGRAMAFAARLASLDALAAVGAWAELRATVEQDLDRARSNTELAVLYGEALMRLGLPQEAFDWLTQSALPMEQVANRPAWRRGANLIGAAAFELGHIDEAEHRFERARIGAQEAGDHLTTARALNNLALVASTRGEWTTAMRYYQQAIPSYERVGAVRGIAECHHNIAATLIESGGWDEADEWDRRAMELAREIGNDRLWAFALAGRAEVRLRKEDPAMAIALATRAADAFRQLGDRSSEAHALRLMGQSQLALGQSRDAITTLSAAIDLAEASNVRRVLGECRLARARAYLVMREANAAVHDVLAAHADFTAMGATEKAHIAAQVLRAAQAAGGHGDSATPGRVTDS